MSLEYLDFNTWISLYHSIEDFRDRVIFGILYGAGCCEKELVNLKINDIDFKNRCLSFRSSGKKRISYLNKEILENIRCYLKENKNAKKDDLLFVTRQGRGLSEKRVQQIVSEVSQKIIRKKIVPKTLRYTHIAHALCKKVPVYSICCQTGLKSQRIIQIAEYVNTGREQRYEL
ncbi:MAG: tyrosine-type recombinase/integrase [Candidatus Woesearchaeota archaeon]